MQRRSIAKRALLHQCFLAVVTSLTCIVRVQKYIQVWYTMISSYRAKFNSKENWTYITWTMSVLLHTLGSIV